MSYLIEKCLVVQDGVVSGMLFVREESINVFFVLIQYFLGLSIFAHSHTLAKGLQSVLEASKVLFWDLINENRINIT